MAAHFEPTHLTEGSRRTIGWAALGYAALIYVTLPPEAIAINDDFAYLKSVVQTLQHGRPWTNDWLEPWAASLSGICALVYQLTGRFHLATAGVQAALAGISFWTLANLWVGHGCAERRTPNAERRTPNAERRTLGVTWLVLTFPTVLWKSLEFTGMALHLPCLLLALFAAQRKRWGLFMVVWLIALANRQSAIAWATFPGVAVLGAWFQPRGFAIRAWWRPALVAMVGIAAWIFVSRTMNKTVSQTMITDQVFHQASWKGALPGLLAGATTFLLAAGWGNFARRGNVASPALRRPISIAVAAVLAAGAIWIDARDHLSIEHPCFGGTDGWFYTKLLAVIAVVGWWRGGFSIRPDLAVCALGSLVLISLRSEVWDYYLIDIAVFGFFAAVPRDAAVSVAAIESRTTAWLWGVRAGVATLVVFHAFFFLQLKFKLDRGLAFCSVVERALRAGQLGPEDLSFPPFGFIGWHLHPYYAVHEGKGSNNIGGFDLYQRRDVAAVHSRYGGWLRALPVFRDEPFIEKEKLLVHERRRIAWFFPADYWLVRLPAEKITPANVQLNQAEYRRIPFPLNNAEWSALIDGPGL